MSYFDTGEKIREINNKIKNQHNDSDVIKILCNSLIEFGQKIDKVNENLENLTKIIQISHSVVFTQENIENLKKTTKIDQKYQEKEYIPSIDTDNISMGGKETKGKIILSNLSNSLDIFEELENK